MKTRIDNIIKGWVTTLIGTATMIVSLILVWRGVIDFIWEGVGGLTIGCVLLLAPRTVEKKVSQVINGWSKNSDNSKVDNPD